MKSIVLSTLLTTATAFAPANLPTSRPHRTRHALSAITALPKLPKLKLSNPYNSLPWIQEREKDRRERHFEYETAAMFRELGLPFDATYEDVKEKTDQLIEIYKDDVKKRIRVEVARDKIYMIRLNESIQVVEDWSDEDYEEDENEAAAKKKEPTRIPIVSGLISFGNSVYMPPDDAWKKRQFIIWGASTLFCLINPPMVENFSRVNWLAAGGMMGYRGMPGMEKKEPGYNPFRGKRNKAHQVQAMGVAIAFWILAKAFAESFVMRIPALVASRSCEWFKFAIVQGMMMISCLYVQTYKGEGGKTLMI